MAPTRTRDAGPEREDPSFMNGRSGRSAAKGSPAQEMLDERKLKVAAST